MVVRFLLSGRGDPVAAVKAACITAALYGGASMVPNETKVRLVHWVMEDAQAPFVLGGLFLGFILFLTMVGFRAELWRALAFRAFPRVSSGQHTAAVLWLHGVGDSGSGFVWLRHELAYLQHVVVALPDATMRPVKAAEGHRRRAWFDITKMVRTV